MRRRGTAICACGCLSTSLLFLALAVSTFVLVQVGILQETLDNYIRKEATLKPGHESYKQWVHPTIPMYKDFYIFNLTNPSEFARGEKPSFKELGPYRYRENRKKTILEQGDGTITYVMSRTFHFNSTGEYTENDTITTINFAYVAAIYNANTTKLRDDLQLVIDTSVHPKPELVIHTTVYKLLWEYTDPLINELYKLRKTPSPYIYLQLNNSYSDRELPSIVHSGTKDSLKTAQFIQWAGLKELPFWRNKANFIHNSTEGLLFHPFIHQDEELQVFISDANRTFHLHYRNKVKVRGIDAYRFRLLDSDFRPDPNYLTGNNTPIGLIYLGVLQNPEAPVYGSKPHFLDCDESLHKAVEGISPPNRNRDDILADIEPITGSSLRLHQRIQLLINVSQTSGHFKSFHHITPVYFPLFYLDEYATLDEKLAAKLNEMVFTPIKTVHTGVWVLFGLCCFISLTTGLCTIRWCANLCKYGDWVEERRPLILQKTDS